MTITNMIIKKRIRNTLIIFILLIVLLIIRIAWIQFINGSSLQEKAYKQQTRDRIISPKRGTIYDATGKRLAVSASVETVTIEPKNIKKENKEMVAKKLSEILGIDYEETLKKVNKNSSIETVAKKIEKDKTDVLRQWIIDDKVKGINIDEDTKRYYPYNDLASSIIGFCGDDNQGLEGIEKTYDETLKGMPGKIVASKDAVRKRNTDDERTIYRS